MPRILLAEDNPADVHLIRVALAEHGVQCTMRVASDGMEVLGIIAGKDPADAGAFALIILDVNLPRYSGIEVLERMRELAWQSHVPVVIMTSSDSPLDRLAATNLGAQLYLRKPSNLEKFLAFGAVFKELIAGQGLGPNKGGIN